MKLFTMAESLGGIESLSCHPASMTHASVPKEVREGVGITDSLFCDHKALHYHSHI